MAGKVFINYRRDEDAGIAGRLYDHLSKEFDQQNVFMDVDSIRPGFDYIKQPDDQVAKCCILLAVIGSRWLDATDASGQRRLDKPNDFVRAEIASALKRDIPVVPVLLDGATMPQESELPEDLKALTRRQAVELRNTRFVADSEVIIRCVREVLPRRGLPHARIAAAIAAFVLAAAAGAYWLVAPHGNRSIVVSNPVQKDVVEQTSRGSPQKEAVEQKSQGAEKSSGTTKPADGKSANLTWRSFTVRPTLDRVRTGETFKRPYLGIQV